MGDGTRLEALRGATTCESNSREEIVRATSELLEGMIEKNEISENDILFILFTATADLTKGFPAEAVRNLGLRGVPAICARELEVEDSLPRTIRILMVFYTSKPREDLKHVYLKGATSLPSTLPR